MKKIVLEKDYGKKETFEKWNGKFLDDSSYDKVYKVTQKEDLGIMKPVKLSLIHISEPTRPY